MPGPSLSHASRACVLALLILGPCAPWRPPTARGQSLPDPDFGHVTLSDGNSTGQAGNLTVTSTNGTAEALRAWADGVLGNTTAITAETARAKAAEGATASPAAATANRPVFIGGVSGFSELATSSVANPLIATGRIGLYEHGNGMQGLGSGLAAMLSAWAGAGVNAGGGGRGMGEVGCNTTAAPSYVAYFGSAYPVEVNKNCITGAGDGDGSYTTGTANGDTTTGTTYGGFLSAGDLATVETAMAVDVAAGARNAALFVTPNGGGEDLVDAFATGGYWANARTAISYGGGVALDTPPAYFIQRGAAYQSMVAQMIVWAEAQGARATLVLSPFAIVADASGNTGPMGYDPQFLAEARTEIDTLRGLGAVPTSYVVENYGLGGTENQPIDKTGNGLVDVAAFLANFAGVAPAGTAAPVMSGGAGESNLESDPASPLLAARVSAAHAGPLAAADIGSLGLGTMASESSNNVRVSLLTDTGSALFAGGLTVYGTLQGTGTITTTGLVQGGAFALLNANNAAILSQNTAGGTVSLACTQTGNSCGLALPVITVSSAATLPATLFTGSVTVGSATATANATVDGSVAATGTVGAGIEATTPVPLAPAGSALASAAAITGGDTIAQAACGSGAGWALPAAPIGGGLYEIESFVPSGGTAGTCNVYAQPTQVIVPNATEGVTGNEAVDTFAQKAGAVTVVRYRYVGANIFYRVQ